MLIQRTGDIEACPSGRLSCASSKIIVTGGGDSNPITNTPDTPVSTTNYYSRPGVHRFIGIGMVIVLFIIAVALWVYFAKYPRRKLTAMGLGCCVRRLPPIDTAAGGSAGGDAEAHSEKAQTREKEKARNEMLQAEPRGVIKAVSGGVVVYTEAPRAAVLAPPSRGSRDRPPTTEWAFEHVHGVRYEARSSIRTPTSSSAPRPRS